MREEKDLFAEVALALPITKHLHYRVPEHLQANVEIGKRVLIPLGKRRVTGYVLELLSRPDIPEPRDIIDVLDDQPLFTSHHLSFYRWISAYYFYPLGGVIKTALPSGIDIESRQVISLTGKGRDRLNTTVDFPGRSLLKVLQAIMMLPL